MDALSCIITGKNEVSLSSGKGGRALAAHQVRIRTRYSLISPGTELAMFLGQHIGISDSANIFAKYPFAAGYAAVGEVLETAPDVGEFRAGDTVYYQGAHESPAVVDIVRHNVRLVPAGIDPKFAPFARLAQIAYTAVFVARAAAPKTVAIVGLGLIGNLAAQLFQAEGHTVIATDALAARREWARACGIAKVVETTGDDLVSILKSAAGQRPIDMCIECTGVPSLAQICLETVSDRGQVILLGSPRGKTEIDIYNNIHRSGVSLIGAHERLIDQGTNPSRRSVADDMLARIADGRLVIAPLLSRIALPAELTNCYDMLDKQKDRALGVLIDWNREEEHRGRK